jgi:hypothetical protein
VEHGPEYIEEDWCTRAHVGYLISGKLHIEFREREDELFSTGDGIQIGGGESHAYRGHVRSERPVLMFLVD